MQVKAVGTGLSFPKRKEKDIERFGIKTERRFRERYLIMIIFIEFLLSTALGIFFHIVLHYEEVAYVIFGVGILLSLATHLLSREISHTHESLLNHYKFVYDISAAMLQFKDPEFDRKAGEILVTTKKSLSLLKEGYMPLNESELYLEATKAIKKADSRVKTVDPFIIEWNSRGSLLNYYQVNLEARKRGTHITRIFVINHWDLTDPAVQNVLHSQFQDNIDIRIVYREYLPTGNWSFDFVIVNDSIVIDRSSGQVNYAGYKTSVPSEVKKYLHLFDIIEHNSHPILIENGIITTNDAASKLHV